MIDRRRVMTPSARSSNIRRAQLRGVVTNDPRGAAHLPPVSRRERRYFYLFAATPSRGSILLNSWSRARARWGVYTRQVRAPLHSLNPSGAVANAAAFSPEDSSAPATRDSFNTGREKGIPFTRRLHASLFSSLGRRRRRFLSTLLSRAIALTGPIGTR